MTDLDDRLRAISRLTKPQRETLGMIAVGQDGGHYRVTLAALEKQGMIEAEEQKIASGIRGVPLIVKRYQLPLPWHYAWCEWCSRQPNPEGEQ